MQSFLQQLANGVLIGANYVLVALGLTVIFSIYRLLNLAHGEIYMLGAYAAYLATAYLGLNFWVATLLSMALMAGASLVMERIVFRPIRAKSEEQHLLVSLGLFILLENLALLAFGADPVRIATPYDRQSVYLPGGVVLSLHRVLILVTSIIAVAVLQVLIYKTRRGKQMRAVAQDQLAAQLMGINVNRVAQFTFMLAGALAAMAGAFIGSLFALSPFMGFFPMLMGMVIIIFGGMGSIIGAIVAGTIIGIIQSMGVYYVSGAFGNTLAFLILYVVLLVRPTGLFGRG